MSLFEESGRKLSPGLPATVVQCTRTRITAISDRFGAALDRSATDSTGTAVTFADGGHQVSYETEAAVAQSAIGDEVLLCLVSIPENCPRGDDRGKVYSATNLRTKGSWEMPDAQHSCGGA